MLRMLITPPGKKNDTLDKTDDGEKVAVTDDTEEYSGDKELA